MKPTVGRIVHYYPTNPTGEALAPLAAIVVAVWSDSCVNLAIFDPYGNATVDPPRSVTLIQEGVEAPTGGCYCAWWPRD